VFFSGYLYGFYFTGLGVMIGIIWVDLCKGLIVYIYSYEN
jgi:hypothetical protein